MISFKVKPWTHQLEAITRARTLASFALLFEVGTGKTMTAINILRQKFTDGGRLQRTLILAPPIVLENWKREFRQHSAISDITILKGAGADREDQFVTSTMDDTKKGHVFITNYETLLMDQLFELFLGWQPEVLVCDEVHRCKNLSAKRTKRTIKLSDIATTKLTLTGTAITNTPLDIFAQWRILDGGETFGENYFSFRAKYFYDRNASMPKAKHFPDWRPTPTAFDDINAKLKKYSMRVKKSDCLDLPPLVRKEVFVELGKDQARMYKEMKADFISFFSSTEAAVATLAITKALRLMQICSGFVTTEKEDGTKSKKRLEENPRAAALRDLLEELTPDHKCIVWCVFKDNYDTVRAICESLGLGFVEIHGEVTPKAKNAAVDRFNTDPDCRVLFGHPKSGGIGINLVAASYSIFYSRSFSLEDDIQAAARNYRGGSEIHAKITRIDLIAKGTIDEEIAARLAAKLTVSEAVLRDIAGHL